MQRIQNSRFLHVYIFISEIGVEKPEYTAMDDEHGNTVLKINMPRITSAAECDLNISKVSKRLHCKFW